MKIAIISPWNVRCGIASYTKNLAEALAKLDVDVYICRWPRFGIRTPELIENCVLDKIPVDKIGLIHVMHEYGLFTPNLEGVVYAYLRRLGKPIVSTMHAVGSFAVDKIVSEYSDKVIVHNLHCFRSFQGDRGKATIIAHGCDPKECPPTEECKRSLGIDPRIPVVGYVGFISPAKGLETLIEAMVKVPNAALLIGGGWFVGEETDYIMRLKQWSLQVLPGRCMWLGYVPDERLATVYGACDIIVYPSIYASESGALLMALSHGRPTIASNIPPFKEKERQGALITFRDVNDLTWKIKRLLADKDVRMKYAEGARRYAESVRWYPNIAQAHVSLYRSLTEKV